MYWQQKHRWPPISPLNGSMAAAKGVKDFLEELAEGKMVSLLKTLKSQTHTRKHQVDVVYNSVYPMNLLQAQTTQSSEVSSDVPSYGIIFFIKPNH